LVRKGVPYFIQSSLRACFSNLTFKSSLIVNVIQALTYLKTLSFNNLCQILDISSFILIFLFGVNYDGRVSFMRDFDIFL